MDNWLKNPASLFDVRGKRAIVVGASGAFGAVAAQTLAGAGARLMLSASRADELESVAKQCRELGAEVATVQLRPNLEADANAIVAATVEKFGGVDIVVVASGMNDVSMIVDMASERFAKVMDANVTGSWMLARADELESVAKQCRELGAQVATVQLRPNLEADANAIVAATVEKFGGVDIVVVASGMNDVSMIVDMPPERFAKVMEANVTGSWMIARAAGAQMIKQGGGGKVVLTSSARGLLGHPAGYTAYCASKAAVDGITKALGCEWGKYGITVNAIAPTVFRSPLTAWMFEDNDKANTARNGFLTRVPLGRLGEPSDLAGPLLFLCSAASNFYTGHILYADGGYTAG